MTRETKVGIVVALAFVLLIAGVVAYKVYVLGEGMPQVADAMMDPAAAPMSAPQAPAAAPVAPPAKPPQPEPPAQAAPVQIAEAPASMALVGPFLQQLHEGTNHLVDASTQGLITLLSKREGAATATAPAVTGPAPEAVAANPPAPMPPPPEMPAMQAPTPGTSPSPLAARPATNSSTNTDEQKQPPKAPPAVVNVTAPKAPEVTKNDSQPMAPVAQPEPPAMKTQDSIKPPMPQPVADANPPAGNGKPPAADATTNSGGTSGNRPNATLAPPQTSPAPKERPADTPLTTPRPSDAPRTGGIPVTIRQQPDLVIPSPAAAAPAASPAQPPPSNSAAPTVNRNGARVEGYDVVIHDVQPGDSYAEISKNTYGSDRYQAALAAFNHELDPQAATLTKGQRLRVPPAQVLERRYRNLIPGLPEPPPEQPAKSPVQMLPPRQPARLVPNLGAEQTVPALGSPVPNVNAALPAAASAKEAAQAEWAKDAKQYRVQPNDTIWSIAKHALGKGERWPEISRLNRDVLPDVNQLKAGMTLRLPADAKVDTPETPQ
jgi:LysM repeat protein